MPEPESPTIVTVTPDELAKTMAIWIKTAPKRVWMDFWHHSETIGKWSAGSDPVDRFDPRVAMAAYLAAKFAQADWCVTYAERTGALAPYKSRSADADGEGGQD